MKFRHNVIPVFLILLLILVGSGCDQGSAEETRDPTAGTLQAPSTSTPDLSSASTEETQLTPPVELPSLEPAPQDRNLINQITAELDYFNKMVMVDQLISIPQPSALELDELVISVPPNFWPNTFVLEELTWNGSKLDAGYNLDGVLLTITLPDLWQPGQIGYLGVSYRLELPPQKLREDIGYGPFPFGYTDLQINLVDWYLQVPPYQEDEGWIVHQPWLFGEYLVYPLTDFDVTLVVNDPALITAASTTGEKNGGQLSYQLENARNFAFSVSPHYQVSEVDVNGTMIYSYIFPFYSIPGQAALEATREAVDLYSSLFGPYHQDSLSLVQADFNHGMEYEGLFFLNKSFFDTYNGSQESYLTAIAVHETAHQWWYGKVGNDQALEPWLDEALCTYSELLYYENLYPDAVNWWWETRVDYFNPTGVIDRSIYDFKEYTDQYLAYRDATYLQGAKFLVRLRETLGEEEMEIFLREYANQHEKQIASKDDFFSLLGDYIEDSDLDWLDEYFRE
jgi:hypothetical protein